MSAARSWTRRPRSRSDHAHARASARPRKKVAMITVDHTTTTTTLPCDDTPAAALERTRFFPRQLITPDDLTQDQIYFREKSRRHNRMLHGWGVVCGVGVSGKPNECEIVIEPGYILG